MGISSFFLQGGYASASDSVDSFLLNHQQVVKTTCTAPADQRAQLASLLKSIHHCVRKGHSAGRTTGHTLSSPLQMSLEEQWRLRRIIRCLPLSSSKQDFPAKLSQHHALPRRTLQGSSNISCPLTGLGQEGAPRLFSPELAQFPAFKSPPSRQNITLPCTCEIPDQTQPA